MVAGEQRFAGSAIFLSVLLGLLVGIGGFTFLYAEGFSYMSDDPEVCANCHIIVESGKKAMPGIVTFAQPLDEGSIDTSSVRADSASLAAGSPRLAAAGENP